MVCLGLPPTCPSAPIPSLSGPPTPPPTDQQPPLLHPQGRDRRGPSQCPWGQGCCPAGFFPKTPNKLQVWVSILCSLGCFSLVLPALWASRPSPLEPFSVLMLEESLQVRPLPSSKVSNDHPYQEDKVQTPWPRVQEIL